MTRELHIALIGDRDDSITAHRALPLALTMAAEALSIRLQTQWLTTDTIGVDTDLSAFDGLWCVPGSPYRSVDGALRAIRHAREHGVPFLGTCGGFQHAVIEFARHVLGWADADHAETAPDAPRAVIEALSCSLVEVQAPIALTAGSRLAVAYEALDIVEGYHCRYGLAPRFADALTAGPLRATAHDAAGEVRGIELDGHPFFVATLFQPERGALAGRLPPPVHAFVDACRRRRAAFHTTAPAIRL